MCHVHIWHWQYVGPWGKPEIDITLYPPQFTPPQTNPRHNSPLNNWCLPLNQFQLCIHFQFWVFQGGLTVVPWVTWLFCGYDYWSHWGKLKGSRIGKCKVKRYQKNDNRPDYQKHYHWKHISDESIYLPTIGVKNWSLVCPPNYAYGNSWAWSTEWMLMCPYINKRLSIRVGFSYDYVINRKCGTS